jgi:hypothetical protein
MFKNPSKNKKALLLIFITLLIAGVFLSLYYPVIFQEGNPWPQIKGIAQLNFGNSNIVKLSDSDNKYITKSKNSQEVIKDFMKDKDYEFKEQMGSGYLFKSPNGESAVAVHKYYGRYYSLWSITEKAENSLAEELRDCLPKSDTVSHEKCNELLKQITNFDDCVVAGFSIMKSNPPQCATPDGRTFIQETNSTREQNN